MRRYGAGKPVRIEHTHSALADPASFSTLPNPGGISRTATSGVAAGIVALGGNPAAPAPARLGSANTPARAGGGFLGFLFGGGNRNALALNPSVEAARLRGLGVPVLGGN